MSKIDDIKKVKRQKTQVTPAQALVNVENNVDLNKEINEVRKEVNKVERKRVSFDLRTDLHRELKMQSIVQDKNIYILIEEALEKYLNRDQI